MEFHRGRVNQKFEGVYKRGDGGGGEAEERRGSARSENGTQIARRNADTRDCNVTRLFLHPARRLRIIARFGICFLGATQGQYRRDNRREREI